TAMRFEAGRSKKDVSVMSGELEVALQLPGGHGPLILPDLPGAGAEIVVHEFLAEQLAGDGAPVEEGDGVAQVAWERRGLDPIGVAGDRIARLDTVLDAPEPRGERGGHSHVGVHVRA